MSLTSVDLPDPLTPVTAVSTPSGNDTVTSCRLFSRAPWTTISRFGRERSPHRRGLDLESFGEVRTRHRVAAGEQLVDGAGDDHLSAVLAGAGTDVDHPVGGADRVLVVLDDDQGVAEVAQPDQRLDQPMVVALVQADARLVEHVQHADQAGPDLGRQPDPLRLAAGERAGRSVEGEVVQADVDQEPQPLVDLLEDADRDLLLARRQLE